MTLTKPYNERPEDLKSSLPTIEEIEAELLEWNEEK
jgi:hypothetical protein